MLLNSCVLYSVVKLVILTSSKEIKKKKKKRKKIIDLGKGQINVAETQLTKLPTLLSI